MSFIIKQIFTNILPFDLKAAEIFQSKAYRDGSNQIYANLSIDVFGHLKGFPF